MTSETNGVLLMSESEKLIKDVGHFSLSNILLQLIGILSGLIKAKFLGPNLLGIWSGLRVILAYSDNFSLGLRHGMNLEVPLSIGRKEFEEAERLKDNAFTGSMLACVLVTLGIIIAYVVFSAEKMELLIVLGLVVIAFLCVSQELSKLYISLFRIDKNIFVLSKANAFFPVIELLLVIVLTFKLKLYGVYIAVTMVALMNALYLFKKNTYRFKFRISSACMKRMFKSGVPILGIGLIATSLLTVDRLMILKFLTTKDLGYYSLALFVANFMLQVPHALGFVVFPRLAEKVALNGRASALENYVLKPAFVISYCMPILIALLYYSVPTLIVFFLPKYVPSLDALRVMIVGMFFAAICGMQDTFLTVLKKFKKITIVKVFCLLTSVLLNYSFIKAGMGIKGVALATVITYFLSTTIITSLSLKYFNKSILPCFMTILCLYCPFGVCIGLIIVLDLSHWYVWLGMQNPVLINSLKLLLFILFYSPMLLFLERRYSAVSDIMTVIKGQLRK